MNKRFTLILLLSVFSTIITKAEWIPFSKERTKAAPPQVTLISSDAKSTVFRVELSGVGISEIVSGGKSYQSIDLMTESHTTVPGSPLIPYLSELLAVPDQAGITAEVIETGKVLTYKGMHLQPACESQWEGQILRSQEENQEAYSSRNPFPENSVMIDPPSVFRDFRIARVSVYPVSYIAARKELQIISSLTIRVSYGKGPVINPKNTPRKKISPSFGKIYRSAILNYQEMLNTFYRGTEDGRDVILCIMPDGFYDSFQPYATWKRQSGTDVRITRFSEIGANANNPTPIRNHITDAYNTWEYPPTYVLMIGDDGKFPKKIATFPDYSFPWEEYFVTVDGVDFIPDIMVGRFTNETDFTLQVMVNKFKLYEKTPYVTNSDWFKKGVCCSNNAYASQISTKRFAYSRMMEGGFTSVDTLMSDGDPWTGQECTVDLDDVTSAINNGRSFLNYRGEGWDSGWSASCYSFQVQDVTGLNNGQMMPFVTSIGCGVAMFDTWNGNCFGEEWIEMGSIANPKGAACFIGPTSNTHTAYNNSIDRGIYVGMFREEMDTPGQAMLRGKLYLYNSWGVNDPWVEYHYKIYCILGDPSIHIWKDLPQQVTCNYPSTVNVGDNHIEVYVEHLATGQPVNNAEVCITGAEVFATGICNENGIATIDFTPETVENLTITIRGGNVIPFQGIIAVVQPAELVMPENLPAADDLDGNNDGLVNPNEHSILTYTLKNWGSGTASNVQATLSTSNPEFVEIITTNAVNFGTITAGGTSSGNPFQFYISPSCPVGQMVSFQLHVTSSTSSWDYVFDLKVSGCDVGIRNYVVHDFSAAEPDFRLNPGETVALVLELENTGDDNAVEVTGNISSENPYVEIPDAFGDFGTMIINDTAQNNTNYFKFSVSPSCPAGSVIDFQVLIETNGGLYPYQTVRTFSIPVSGITPADYTGPDAYGYYAYTGDDSFFDQTPVFDWMEISGVGSVINTGGASEYTRTVSIPFSFKYYGNSFTQVRVSTDGWIAFGSGTQTAFNNQVLPNDDNVNNMVAVFWDNLINTDYVNGNILTYNDQANHRFIVEWDGVTINSNGTSEGWAKFQAILLDPAYYHTVTGDGEILVQYLVTDDVLSMTAGIENAAQDIGLLYVCNNIYDLSASEIKAGSVIKYTTNPPFETIITSVEESDGINSASASGQNKPNPFRSGTLISYTISEPGPVSVNIYDFRGILIKTLYNGHLAAGQHEIIWDGTDDHGSLTAAGVYFYRIEAEDNSQTGKMVRLN